MAHASARLGVCVIAISLVSSGRALNAIEDQPDNSVELINDGKDQLTVYVEYANTELDPPPTPWAKLSGDGNLAAPEKYGPNGDHPANDVGAATWQLVSLSPGKSITLQIPDFPKPQAWSLRPLKYINGEPCSGGGGDCGMPILVESGKNMVGDMSAVDGVNYNLKYEMTAKDGITTIDFKSNPCKAINAPSSKGCRNPQVDVPDWNAPPCPAGTCHNQGVSKTWCDTIHEGQCANSTSTWENAGIGYKDCAPQNQFTTYCYSHDDANSSPYFSAPYKMRLTYSDLDIGSGPPSPPSPAANSIRAPRMSSHALRGSATAAIQAATIATNMGNTTAKLSEGGGLTAHLKQVKVVNNCAFDVEIGEFGDSGTVTVNAGGGETILPSRPACPNDGGTCAHGAPFCASIANDGPCYEPNRFKWRHAGVFEAFDYIEMNGPFLGTGTDYHNPPNFANWGGFNGIGISVVAYKPGTKDLACYDAGGAFVPDVSQCATAGGTIIEPSNIPDKFQCQFPDPTGGSGVYTCGSKPSDYLQSHYFALYPDETGKPQWHPIHYGCPAPEGSGEERAECYAQVGYWVEPTQPCFVQYEPKQPDAARPGIGIFQGALFEQQTIDVEFVMCPNGVN